MTGKPPMWMRLIIWPAVACFVGVFLCLFGAIDEMRGRLAARDCRCLCCYYERSIVEADSARRVFT